MPQTLFVLKKALARALPVIVVINKIDKPAARPEWVVNEIFDLLVNLGAPDRILDFQTVYTSATEGTASVDPDVRGADMRPLLDAILEHIPAPTGDPDGPLQLQICTIDHCSYLGRLGIGKMESFHPWILEGQGALRI